MPSVPVEQSLRSLDVSSYDTQAGSQGLAQSALGKLGDVVANIGGNLLKQTRQIEANNEATGAFTRRQLQSEKVLSEITLNAVNGEYRDPTTKTPIKSATGNGNMSISEYYNTKADSWYEQDQLNMGSQMAQEEYKSQSRKFFVGQSTNLFNQEQAQRVKFSYDSKELRDVSRMDSLVTFSDLNKLYSMDQVSRTDWQQDAGTLYNQNAANEKIAKNQKGYALSTAKYAINQVEAIPKKGDNNFERSKIAQQWIARLNEDPNNPTSQESIARKRLGLPIFSEMMDPEHKAAVVKTLLELGDQSKKQDAGLIKWRFEEAKALSATGQGRVVDPDLIPQIRGAVNNGGLKNYEGASMIADLKAQKLRYDFLDRVATLTPDAALGLAKEYSKISFSQTQAEASKLGIKGAPELGGTNMVSFLEDAEKSIADLAKERKKDNQAYIQKYYQGAPQELKAFLTKTGGTYSIPSSLQGAGPMLRHNLDLSLQENTKFNGSDMSDFRYLTLDASKDMGKYFKQDTSIPQNRQDLARSVMILKNEYGPKYFSQVINQMIRDKNLPKEFSAVGYFSNSQSETESLLSGISFNPHSPTVMTVLGAAGISEKGIELAISSNPTVKKYIASEFISGEGDNSRVSDTIIKGIRGQIGDLAGGTQTDISEAVTQASSYILNNFHFTGVDKNPDNIFHGVVDLRIPKTIQGVQIREEDANKISTYISHEVIPTDKLKKLGAVVPPDFKLGDDKFYQQVQNTLKVRIGKLSDRIEVVYKGMNDGKYRQLTTKDGQPFSVSVSDALQWKPPVETKRIKTYSGVMNYSGVPYDETINLGQ